jgi:hypothetical protein
MWELLLVGADVVVECVRVSKRRSPKTFNARVLNLGVQGAVFFICKQTADAQATNAQGSCGVFYYAQCTIGGSTPRRRNRDPNHANQTS